jgi:hypothetical protein
VSPNLAPPCNSNRIRGRGIERQQYSNRIRGRGIELGISFEFAAVAFDPFGPSPLMGLSAAADESVAVHVTVGTDALALVPASIRVIKQLRPAVVVCVDHGCDRADLPLPNHALNVLRS